MNLDERVREAVTPIVPICLPMDDDSEEPEYIAFSYSERGGAFGDDTADVLLYELSLHWYLPKGVNPNRKKRLLRDALEGIGFTTPEILNASDEDGQHFVFECRIEGGTDGEF